MLIERKVRVIPNSKVLKQTAVLLVASWEITLFYLYWIWLESLDWVRCVYILNKYHVPICFRSDWSGLVCKDLAYQNEIAF